MLGTVHKGRPQSRGLSSVDIFRTRGRGLFQMRSGFLQMRLQNPDFSKFMVCPHGQGGGRGGWASTDILRTRRREGHFSRFCADVLYGWPLVTSKKEPNLLFVFL